MLICIVRYLTVFSLLLATLWSSSPALAQSEDDARGRAHFLAGSSYFESGDYEAAAREFQEAFELSGRPEMLLNVSSSHHKAGNLDAAIAALELLLTRYPKTSLKAEAEARLAELRAERGAQPPPAEPEPAAVEAVEEAAPPAEQPAPPSPEPPPQRDQGLRVGTATWIVGGAAVALGVTALTTGLISHGRYGECDDGGCAQSRIDSGETLQLVSIITLFTGVAAAGTAVTMFFLEVGVEKPQAVSVSPALSPAFSGLSLRTQF